jgi:putative DNA primase/helicase
MANHKNKLSATPAAPWPYLYIVEKLGLGKVMLPKKHMASPRTQVLVVSTAGGIGDGVIPESSRNTTLTSLAGSMRRNGMSEHAIDVALQKHNQEQCRPQLDPDEVSAIAASVARYAPTNPNSILETLTDTGNADRFAYRWQEGVRYVPEWKKWLLWDGRCWVRDDEKKIIELAKTVARDVYLEGVNIADPSVRDKITKHSGRSQQEPRLRAMISLAESIPSLVAKAGELDQRHDLLCVANGTINLTTGRLQKAQQSDLLTQYASVIFDPKATCPVFIAFLTRIMGGNMALVNYVQRVFGYTLTGHTGEQCLFFLYGHGANGKSTLLNVLSELLGSNYSKQTPSETLMAKFGGRSASNDLARLQGARAVIANEIEGGAHLAEAMIKQITGGDLISARYLYAEYFEFKPVFKLFMAGNHKPVIRGDDDGIWRRIQLVPFEVTIPEAERDHDLAAKLRAELPGILNWAIEGCLVWKKSGMSVPDVITDAVKEYRDDMDIMGQWLSEEAEIAPSATWAATEAYDCCQFWLKQNGFKPMNIAAFGRKFSTRFKKARNGKGVIYHGVGPCRLSTPTPTPPKRVLKAIV